MGLMHPRAWTLIEMDRRFAMHLFFTHLVKFRVERGIWADSERSRFLNARHNLYLAFGEGLESGRSGWAWNDIGQPRADRPLWGWHTDRDYIYLRDRALTLWNLNHEQLQRQARS
jgi:hypothetical protein